MSSRVTCAFDGGVRLKSGCGARTALEQSAVYDPGVSVAQPADCRYTLPYDAYLPRLADPNRREFDSPPSRGHVRRTVGVAQEVRTTTTREAPQTSVPSWEGGLERLPSGEVRHAHGLFVQIRWMLETVEWEITPAVERLRNELLIHPVMRHALKHGANVAGKICCLPNDLRNDLIQEAILIVRSRITSSRVHFRDEGPVRFVGWLEAVAVSACLEATRTPRLARLSEVTFVRPEMLAIVVAVSPIYEVDDRDFAERMTTVINVISDQDTREAMHDWRAERTLAESADRLKTTLSRVVRLRQNGLEILRRIWPAGIAGLQSRSL
jgi:hypothetical protein